jgi:predicted DNA-binding transcriptional regulator AlpA
MNEGSVSSQRNEVRMQLHPDGYTRQRQLLERIPISPATLWRKVKSGEFPRPVKLSAGCTAWKNSEVLAWERTREALAPPTVPHARPGRKGANSHEKAA